MADYSDLMKLERETKKPRIVTPPSPQKDDKPVADQEKKPIENLRPASKGDDATTRLQDDPAQRLHDATATRLPDDATTKRTIKRQSINFYADQLKYLKDYSWQKEGQGVTIGISEMIRDAIDTYIAKLKEQQ